jgi:ethanolamine utilization microcompartment shell protein EutS
MFARGLSRWRQDALHHLGSVAVLAVLAMSLLPIACRGSAFGDPNPRRGPEQIPVRLPVAVGGKYGYIDRSGALAVQPTFDFASAFSDGLAEVRVGSRHGFIDHRGMLVITELPGEVRAFSEDRAAFQKDGKWGFIDRAGHVTIAAKFDSAESFAEDAAAVRVGDLWGYIDRSGTFIITPAYDNAGSFASGLAPVRQPGSDTIGFIDRRGAIVVPPAFQDVSGFVQTSTEPLARVLSAGKWGFIRRSGRFAIRPEYEDAGDFAENLAPVRLNRAWLYIDPSGRTVLRAPAGVSTAFPFASGRGRVSVRGKFGFLDKTGGLVIPATFDTATDFHEGVARVRVGPTSAYIGADGQFIRSWAE